MAVWEVMRRPGAIGDDWARALFASKRKAGAAIAQWLDEGFTIAGPYRRTVY